MSEQVTFLDHTWSSLDEIFERWEQVPPGGLSQRFVREPYHGQRIVLVGEAPGAEEDERGIPFVGQAGDILNGALQRVGWSRGAVYVLNIVPRRPPNNRKPTVRERGVHGEFAKAALRMINPDLIILLGDTAVKEFLGLSGIGKVRGGVARWENWTVVATWHPAAILHALGPQEAAQKRSQLFADFETAKGIVNKTLKNLAVDTSLFYSYRTQGATQCRPMTDDGWKAFITRAKQSRYLVVDIETNGRTDWWHPSCKIEFISLSIDGETVVCPLDPTTRPDLEELIANHQGIVGHNIMQFDRPLLQRCGFIVPTPVGDTLFWSYLIDENPPHELEYLVVKHLKVAPWKYLRNEDIILYAAIDAYVTGQLALAMVLLLDSKNSQVYERLLAPLAEALTRISGAGMKVDAEALAELEENMQHKVKRCDLVLTGRAKQLGAAFDGINFASGNQVAKLFFGPDGYKLQSIKQSATRDSVDEEVLRELARTAPHPANQMARVMLRKRSLETTLSKYVVSIAGATGHDGRVRSVYNAVGTVTGRTSASEPLGGPGINAQNIDRRPQIRNCFIAEPGKILVQRDLNQVEPRLTAWFSGEKRLTEIFMSGRDLYTSVGSLIFEKKTITAYERQLAKNVVLAMLYDQSVYGLQRYLAARGIWVSENDASTLWHAFHRSLPGIKPWHERIKAEVLKTGVIEAPFGRRRHLPNVFLQGDTREERKMKSHALREAINFKVQSTAGDICSMAIIIMDQKVDWDRQKIINDSHDSMVLEVPANEVDDWVGITGDVMDHPPTKEWFGVEIPIPITSVAKVGTRWGSLN